MEHQVKFCPFYKECESGDICLSAYTEKVAEGSKGLVHPIEVYKEPPACFEEKEK